jgi:hypothetical protein
MIMTFRKQAFTIVIGVVLVASSLTAPAQEPGSENKGFIYGTVTTKSGNSYTGLIRWGTEEAFWDDLFNSAKEELPYADYREKRRRDDDDEGWWGFRLFNRTIRVSSSSRAFIARFGDIKQIKVVGNDDAEVTMKSGTTIEVSGSANDVGNKITVHDQALGDVELSWRKIDTIVFKPTPPTVKPKDTRLQGKVYTDSGEFEGYIQWDAQECLSGDELDGDSPDGRVSIAMGKIASIERRNRRSARVTLRDGRSMVLDGTNDVNSSIDGILVEDSRYGRVEVDWDAFEKVEFYEPVDSGKGYNDYLPSGKLTGTVIDRDGNRHSGEIVFDLDESEGWEILNGESFDIEFNIPFNQVASIERRGESSAKIILKNGVEQRLEDSQDVSDSNDGVLVISGSQKTYVEWSEVSRIDFK